LPKRRQHSRAAFENLVLLGVKEFPDRCRRFDAGAVCNHFNSAEGFLSNLLCLGGDRGDNLADVLDILEFLVPPRDFPPGIDAAALTSMLTISARGWGEVSTFAQSIPGRFTS
jgi:hypothetical protein